MPRISRVEVKAPAKVNLALLVGGLDELGYHPVETLYQSVDIYDTVVAEKSDSLELDVSGDFVGDIGPVEKNLAWRAAELLARHANIEPNVKLTIQKNIPIAGGMAGGSADAAGALIACDALWGLETPRHELLSLAAQLGSDIPFSLVGGTAIGRGRGDQLTTVLARGEFHWVFATSEQGLSTPAVYREFDNLNPDPAAPRIPEQLLIALGAGDVATAAKYLTNDLQPAAMKLRGSLSGILRTGVDAGALAALVSGSGPTCAFLAKNADRAVDIAIALQASGLVQRTLRATGPVKGVQVVAVD